VNVLIVDDSMAHIQQLTALLEGMGHKVIGHARTGGAGVRLFKEQRPQVTMLDIVMPEMDGLSALRVIRSIDADAPVIVLSSMAGVGGQVAKALQLGASAVLTKPYVKEELEAVLKKIGTGSAKP
jgi:two-component system, chemotaxis family, chemotaxis protein CheY